MSELKPKTKRSRRVHRVRDLEQLEALASPARQEVASALIDCQPCTVRELGEYLGRLPESLYYHVNKLVAVGLAVEHGTRPTDRRPETVYRLVGDQLRIDPTDRSPRTLAALEKLGSAILRRAERLNTRAVGAPDRVREGRHRDVALGHRTARLTRSQLARVNAKLDELFELLAEAHSPDKGRKFTFTIAFAPNDAATSAAPRQGTRSRKA